MSTLTLERRAYGPMGGARPLAHAHTQTDFVVDGVALSERFDFEGMRPSFGQTCFEWSPEHLHARALELRGLAPARSQLGEGRFVLYGCHCGVDYCGVLSCVIAREGGEVVWRDVRHEDDDEWGAFDAGSEEGGALWSHRIGELRFDASRYDVEVARHVARVLAR